MGAYPNDNKDGEGKVDPRVKPVIAATNVEHDVIFFNQTRLWKPTLELRWVGPFSGLDFTLESRDGRSCVRVPPRKLSQMIEAQYGHAFPQRERILAQSYQHGKFQVLGSSSAKRIVD